MIRSSIFAAIAALGLFAGTTEAQTASVTLYGAGCRDAANSVNAPVLTVSGTAQLGTPVTIRYIGPNGEGFWTNDVLFLIAGLSQTALPVPRLTQAMSTNCTLLVTPDLAFYPMPMTSSWPIVYLDRWTHTIPSTPAVIGAELFHQWATVRLNTLASPATIDFVTFSNAVKIRAGL